MITVKGKYNEAVVYTDNVENSLVGQLIALCNQEVYKDSKIRIMSDCHSGKGCVVGTTMTIQDRITPNLVGVDISCGMHVVQFHEKGIDFNRLDKVIRENIPSGFNTRDKPHRFFKEVGLEDMNCYEKMSKDALAKASLSVGSLGGGNHFIEVNQDEDGDFYLVIHSGSRNIGLNVAEYYQKLAISYRERGVPAELAALSPEDTEKYLNDVDVMTMFADYNRRAMADEILKKMKWDVVTSFTTCHNYIDTKNRILRKGAISAQSGETVIIPMNMRDGSLICIGKGNPEWNNSAPHGAGRICSRREANRRFTLTKFKEEMKDVWSTSVSRNTIDESPMAYKPMQEIIDNMGDTVEIVKRIKPVYNFKNS